MTDYRAMFDREYIGSWDLPRDRDAIVTIREVKAATLNNGRSSNKKPIVFFAGKEKGMVCNKTNAKTIAAMYGNDTREWVGKAIALYVDKTRDPSGGGEVECIRVRPRPPKAKADAPEVTQ